MKFYFLIGLLLILGGCGNKNKNIETTKQYFVCNGIEVYSRNKFEEKNRFQRSIILTMGNFSRENINFPNQKVKVLGKLKMDDLDLEVCHDNEMKLVINPTCDVSSVKEKRSGSLNRGTFEKLTGYFSYEERYYEDGVRYSTEYFYDCKKIPEPVVK